MAKVLREVPIFVAPEIIGYIDEKGNYILIDERNGWSLDPTNIDDKIKIYERQVLDWFINPAKNLSDKENCGFIILMVCLSYLEGIEQYIKGRSSKQEGSANYFINSIERIYP